MFLRLFQNRGDTGGALLLCPDIAVCWPASCLYTYFQVRDGGVIPTFGCCAALYRPINLQSLVKSFGSNGFYGTFFLLHYYILC